MRSHGDEGSIATSGGSSLSRCWGFRRQQDLRGSDRQAAGRAGGEAGHAS